MPDSRSHPDSRPYKAHEAGAGEWLIEEGIGETRALLIDKGAVRAARLELPGDYYAGKICAARLTRKQAGARRGLAVADDGTEILVDHLPPSLTEGAAFDLVISRAALREEGRHKRPQGRFMPKNEAAVPHAPTSLAQRLGGHIVRAFPPQAWEEVWLAASAARLEFSGGAITLSVTPAMTLIDVDGADGIGVGGGASGKALALQSLPAIARALGWFDLGGSVGIDFPTLSKKEDRRSVDEGLQAALGDWPHERTAMNGFGFVQLVARLEGPSLLHRFQAERPAMCARFACRVAERASGGGAGAGGGSTLELSINPALAPHLAPDWVSALKARCGKRLVVRHDSALALEAPHAQIVP